MGGNGKTEQEQSLLHDTLSSSDDFTHLLKRTGTTWTAVAHIITGVIGAGVLSLSWSVAQLGWIGGPLAMVLFAATTIVSTQLISDFYRYPHPHFGPARCPSYMQAVHLYLGEKWKYVCGVFVQQSLCGCGITYTITAATSIRAIQRSSCYNEGGEQATCSDGLSLYMLLFGALQIIVSQIPNFHNMAWLSVIAAIMSFAYSFIGFGLGFAKVIENGTIQGSITGVPASNMANKIWLSFQAIGDIAFAYPYSVILLEIQDTLKSPPAQHYTMKKASLIAIFSTTIFYLCCGCFGYAAFGNNTPGNLLSGFDFFQPYWLIDFANVCIVLHLVGGYQIYSQPVFAGVERWYNKKYPNSEFGKSLKVPLVPTIELNPFRLCFRTAYVICTTGIAMLFPYFNQVLGVSGALSFWPMVIYFPVEMYCVQNNIVPWTRKWLLLKTFSFVCFVVAVAGVIGSLQGLISAKFS